MVLPGSATRVCSIQHWFDRAIATITKTSPNAPRLAASYAAGILHNHPFVDGNKRTGFVAAYMFLHLNGMTLRADEASAATMTVALASSEIDEAAYAAWLADNSRA